MEEKAAMRTRKNLQNILFISVMLILLVSPQVYWLSLNGNWTLDSILEDRELAVFPQISIRDFKTGAKRIYQGLYTEAGEIFFNQFLDTSFQRRVNRAAAEQMFLRIPLVELSRFFERVAIKSAYLPLPDDALPASFDSQLYVARDESYLMQELAFFTEGEQAAVDERIANYAELMEKYPAIHFYVFNIETLPHSSHHPMARYFLQSDNGRSCNIFAKNRPGTFESFALTSFRIIRKSSSKTTSIGTYTRL